MSTQSKSIPITGNITNQFILDTRVGAKGISVIVNGSLGGGTLLLKVRPIAATTAAYKEFTLFSGDADVYNIGERMEVVLHLTGSTTPSATVFIAQSV